MKKVLIIFVGLILGCNFCFAKSVSCWEEMDINFMPTTVSKMKAYLPSGTNIVRVGTYLKGTRQTGEFVQYGLNTYIVSGEYYYSTPQASDYFFNTNFPYFYNQTYRTTNGATHSQGSGGVYHYQVYSRSEFRNETMLYKPHYIHTYCIVDEGSSGGGGGATGSVNFIIKATS